MSDEKSDPSITQAYRGERSHLVFFDGKHEDGKDQKGRNKHFDEHPLNWVDPLCQMGAIDTYNCQYLPREKGNAAHL